MGRITLTKEPVKIAGQTLPIKPEESGKSDDSSFQSLGRIHRVLVGHRILIQLTDGSKLCCLVSGDDPSRFLLKKGAFVTFEKKHDSKANATTTHMTQLLYPFQIQSLKAQGNWPAAFSKSHEDPDSDTELADLDSSDSEKARKPSKRSRSSHRSHRSHRSHYTDPEKPSSKVLIPSLHSTLRAATTAATAATTATTTTGSTAALMAASMVAPPSKRYRTLSAHPDILEFSTVSEPVARIPIEERLMQYRKLLEDSRRKESELFGVDRKPGEGNEEIENELFGNQDELNSDGFIEDDEEDEVGEEEEEEEEEEEKEDEEEDEEEEEEQQREEESTLSMGQGRQGLSAYMSALRGQYHRREKQPEEAGSDGQSSVSGSGSDCDADEKE